MLADAAPQHRGGDIAIAAFFLRFIQDPQDDPLLAGQSITDVGNLVVRVEHAELK